MKIFLATALFVLLSVGCSNSPAQDVQLGAGQQQAAEQAKSGTQTETTQTEATKVGEKQTTQTETAATEAEFETATFAGGCFWCTEAVFLQLEGVDSVLPGYMGGHVINPTYEQVCKKKTGHAEVIQIQFDPDKVSYEDLLFIFFKTHDPTTLNRQGADKGPQYRSAIFYHGEKQKASAESILKKIDGSNYYPRPIVTEVTAASMMYVAEDYHINYFAKNPGNSYCQASIPTKIKKLKKLFGDKLKSENKK